jgi:hypothetical protein
MSESKIKSKSKSKSESESKIKSKSESKSLKQLSTFPQPYRVYFFLSFFVIGCG